MPLGDAVDDREAEPGALSAASGVAALERPAQPLGVGDARAAIADAQHRFLRAVVGSARSSQPRRRRPSPTTCRSGSASCAGRAATAIHTEGACSVAGGDWIPPVLGRMTHVYPFEVDFDRRWLGDHAMGADAATGHDGPAGHNGSAGHNGPAGHNESGGHNGPGGHKH